MGTALEVERQFADGVDMQLVIEPGIDCTVARGRYPSIDSKWSS